VSAFDVDPAMQDYFSKYCETEIAAGRVRLLSGSYCDFLGAGMHECRPLDLITTNFAPLNLVADLPPLFARFAASLKTDGKLLVSVLNPYFHDLWKSRKWWLRAPRLAVEGRFTTRLHGNIPVTRWLTGRLARQAGPYFTLASIYTPDIAAPGDPPVRVRLANPRDWRRIAATQFLFMVFVPRRDA
jgi:SAM-dependent methyltransferase